MKGPLFEGFLYAPIFLFLNSCIDEMQLTKK